MRLWLHLGVDAHEHVDARLADRGQPCQCPRLVRRLQAHPQQRLLGHRTRDRLAQLQAALADALERHHPGVEAGTAGKVELAR